MNINENIKKYINEVVERGVCLHSFAMFHHGELVAEGYEKHFGKDFRHRLYSVSKTYTSAAIGCLIDEGKLSLSDKVFTFFTDLCPDNLHEYIKEATVRDLLMMATPFSETTYRPNDKDWVYTFFNTEPSHRPGRVFNYDTSATLVLCALVKRLTGKDFSVYLYEKVLSKIGYTCAPECVREPGGVQWGGSGIFATTVELGRFADLFVNGGRTRNGQQLISEKYIYDATHPQICNSQSNEYACFRSHGYGYQVWVTSNGFAFLGMGNQLAICVPEKDFVFVCTSDDQGNGFAREYIFDLLNRYVVNEIDENTEFSGITDLSDSLHLALPHTFFEGTPDLSFNGVTYKIAENRAGFDNIRFEIKGDEGRIYYQREGKDKVLPFGIDRFVDGEFPEEHYSGMTINTPSEKPYRCSAAARFAEKDKLVIRVYVIDRYFGNITANVSFKGGTLDLKFQSTAEWFLTEYKGYLTSEG